MQNGATLTRPASFLPLLAIAAIPAFAQTPTPAMVQSPQFTPGNLVVAVEGCGVNAGTCLNIPNGTGTGSGNSSATGYGDNQAAPLTLFQYTPIGTTSATFVNSLVLPQSASGANLPVSGEYGSSSEGTLQLSGSGQYLTIAGYGIDAPTFNANPTAYGAAPSLALAQSGSLTGQSYTPVPRVVALIDANGTVRSSTALYNVFNLNNPRSVFSANGQTVYVSGQGAGGDATSGLFFSPIGQPNTAPTPITGLDTTGNTVSQDSRDVQIVNNTLYLSVDSKAGSGSNRSYIGTVGSAGNLPTTTVGAPVMLTGFGNTGGTGKVTITTGANSNGNNLNAGVQINLSPQNYFFAGPSVLYVADTGNPKNNSTVASGSSIGDGGLQKWINSAADGSGTWSLAYTLYKGLGPTGAGPVANTSGTGTSGLYGLTGAVSGASVQLYATNSTIADLDPTFLYGITDTLSFTTASQASSETFTQLAAAPSDSNFKGVSFAPTLAAPITPAITWNPPAAIAYGSALSDVQLNATTTVPGTFTYNPPVGTVLTPGNNTVTATPYTLSTTFTPADPITYTTATATTNINLTSTPSGIGGNLVVTRNITRSGGNLLVQINLANTGQSAVTGVTLNTVRIGSTSAASLPLSIGTIGPYGNNGPTNPSVATVFVTIPGSAGAAGAAGSITIAGTGATANQGGVATGASFGSSGRVTLP